ncbi:MAG: Glycosyl hydrolases family 43 [Phormidesmis priestleyi Ana]|uniref:Glycosyl hydrolases family 43 n=1 Tax=Phormidesmis priestleyi Ana TaxID=1666911 RepID=A0A0P7YTH1_9CYAN|nr:MAG: Glycosyl hydrolases family 43 [Phormidesmis priestleyi Ana]
MTIPPSSALQPPQWDPWILKDKDFYRLFYLSGRTDQEPWWKTSWICEARSSDAVHWEHRGPVLQPLDDQGWESGRLFAGSLSKENNTYYLFYSAASAADISGEAIGLATSTDGVSWQRLAQPLLAEKKLLLDACLPAETPTSMPAKIVEGYAGRCNWSKHLHWRDPYVIKATVKGSETQKYYLFFCASLTGKFLYQGGLGLAVAEKIDGPYQLLPPAAGPGISPNFASGTSPDISERATSEDLLPMASSISPNSPSPLASSIESPIEKDASASWPFYHLERPQIIYFQDKYHLFFSCFKEFVNPTWLKTIGAEKVTDSTLYWFVSDSVTGPFEPSSSLPVVPGSEATGLYGTTFSPLPMVDDWTEMSALGKANGEVHLTVLGWYHQDYTLAIAGEFRAIWNASGLKIIGS